MPENELLERLQARSCGDIYQRVASDSDLLNIFSFFLLEQPVNLNVEIATAYIVHSLLVNGDNYGSRLMLDLAKTKEMRLSDLVFRQVVDMLTNSNMITTYSQRALGETSNDKRGRPRIMLRLNKDKYFAALELAEFWEDFLDSPKSARNFVSGEKYNARLKELPDTIIETLDFFHLEPPIYLSLEMCSAYVVHTLMIKGDSYARKLMDDLAETKRLRVSDTVIGRVFDILTRTSIITTYEQPADGGITGDHRGRPRIMMQINSGSYQIACELVEYWEDFLISPSTFSNNLSLEQDEVDYTTSVLNRN